MKIPFLFWYAEDRIVPYSLELQDNDTVETASRMLQQVLLEQHITRSAVYIYSMIDRTQVKILPYDTTIGSLKGQLQLLVVDVDNSFTYSHIPAIDEALVSGLVKYDSQCRDIQIQDKDLIFDSNTEGLLASYNLNQFLSERQYYGITYLEETVRDVDHGIPLYWEELLVRIKESPTRERNLRLIHCLSGIYSLLHETDKLLTLAQTYNLSELKNTARDVYDDDNDYSLILLIRGILSDADFPNNYIQNLENYTSYDIKIAMSRFLPYYSLISMIILCSLTSRVNNLSQLIYNINASTYMFRFASNSELEKLMLRKLVKNTFTTTALCPDLAYREILRRHDHLYDALVEYLQRVPSTDDAGSSSSSISSQDYLDNTKVYMDSSDHNHFYLDARQIHHLPLLEIEVADKYIPYWFSAKHNFDILLPPQSWGTIDGPENLKYIEGPVTRSIQREYSLDKILSNIRPDLRQYSTVTITFIFNVYRVLL